MDYEQSPLLANTALREDYPFLLFPFVCQIPKKCPAEAGHFRTSYLDLYRSGGGTGVNEAGNVLRDALFSASSNPTHQAESRCQHGVDFRFRNGRDHL